MYRVYYYITVYAEASKCVNVARCREKRKKNGLCLHSNHTADIMAVKSAHLARSAGSAGADYINNLTKKKKTREKFAAYTRYGRQGATLFIG